MKWLAGVVPSRTHQGAARPVGPTPADRARLVQTKLHDVELRLRGVRRGFGLKVGQIGKGRYEVRICELVAGHPMLKPLAEVTQRARAALTTRFAARHLQPDLDVWVDVGCS